MLKHVFSNPRSTRQKTNKERASRSKHQHEDALLRGGFARCGYCGAVLQVRRTKGKPYYACGHQYPVEGCRAKPGQPWGSAIAAATLDAEVWQAVERVLIKPAMVVAKLKATAGENVAAVEHEALRKQVHECDRRIDKLVSAVSQAENVTAITVLTKQLDAAGATRQQSQLKRAEAQWRSYAFQQALYEVDNLVAWRQREQSQIGNLSFEAKRQALERIGLQIDLFRDRPISGRWEMTLRPQGVTLHDMKMGEAAMTAAPPVGATVNTTASSTRPPAARCR